MGPFRRVLLAIVLTACAVVPGRECLSAQEDARLSKGQTVYVASYSNVYSGPRNVPFQLSTILSIRNIDTVRSLRITAIDYYDNDGRLLRRYLQAPVALRPLGSHHLHMEEREAKGGVGANFIVRWASDKPMNVPIIESVMIGATSGQGISFVSPGREITE